ncbi:hypothetical protein JQX13_12205 [Archangium violaceum]|uniref:hypothetical protein n=1 Tax=Archangium violaceum TaxID=83451 RepID=UPI00193C7CAB|nr:hypothetical protein [Archangium violaceum]QRK10759.1 hypothetical protein JQX13_12205 [Archangium violaceum]
MGFLSRLFGKNEAVAKGAPMAVPREAPGHIPVAAVSEEYAWLRDSPCACGGAWSLVRQTRGSSPGLPEHLKLDRLQVICNDCGRESVFLFQVDTHSPQYLEEQQERVKGLFDEP